MFEPTIQEMAQLTLQQTLNDPNTPTLHTQSPVRSRKPKQHEALFSSQMKIAIHVLLEPSPPMVGYIFNNTGYEKAAGNGIFCGINEYLKARMEHHMLENSEFVYEEPENINYINKFR